MVSEGPNLISEEEWNVLMPDVTERMHAHIAPFCVPVSKHHDDHGTAWGSGSFMKLHDRIFILTNEHVAQARNKPQQLIYPLGDDDEMHFVRGNHVGYGEPLDIAILPVDENVWAAPHKAKAITVDLIDLVHQPVANELFMFAGFGGDRSGFHFGALIVPGTSSMSREVALPNYSNLDPLFHFALDYRPDLAINAIGNRSLPLPPGFSGSAVWNTQFVEAITLRKEWTPEMATVTGLLWGWPEKETIGCVIATRSEYIRSFLLGALSHSEM